MSEVQSLLNHPITLRVSLALVHFLWQGLALAAVAAGLLVALRRASASARYLALLAVLAAMAICPLLTFAKLSPAPVRVAVSTTAPAMAPAPSATLPATTHSASAPPPPPTARVPTSPMAEDQPRPVVVGAGVGSGATAAGLDQLSVDDRGGPALASLLVAGLGGGAPGAAVAGGGGAVAGDAGGGRGTDGSGPTSPAVLGQAEAYPTGGWGAGTAGGFGGGARAHGDRMAAAGGGAAGERADGADAGADSRAPGARVGAPAPLRPVGESGADADRTAALLSPRGVVGVEGDSGGARALL